MLLNFIWIKEFKNIKNQGFRFSDKYFIDFDIINGILEIRDNNAYIENFFPSNVSSVTAVIGANGAGKSNLFEYLKYTLASFNHGISSGYDYQSIVVFDNDIYYHEDLVISNRSELEARGFIFFDYKDSLAHFTNKRYDLNPEIEAKIYENGYIYYSSILDLRSEHYNFGLVDISTNFLVYDENRKPRFNLNDEINPYLKRIDPLAAFEITEIDRQINFISRDLQNLPDLFPFPKSITIRIEDKYNSYFSGQYEYLKEVGLDELADIMPGQFFIPDKDATESNLLNTYKQIFLYRLMIIILYNMPDKFNAMENGDFRRIIFLNEYSFLEKIFDEKYFNAFKKLVSSLDEILQIAKPLIDEREKEFFQIHDTIELPYNKVTSPLLIDFFDNYKIVANDRDFLAFYWTGLSSGEVTLLNFYSRLNYAVNDIRIDQAKHVVLMIDEGETNLHPEWQMKFISNVINFFNTKLQDKAVQIIATSHSPFLISNLPKTMINFLDKDDEGNCVVIDGLSELKQTFGANINTLYSDSFFLKSTLMGDFAKKKLDRLINVINKEKVFDKEFPNWEIVQKYIDIIGEPIIKGMLQRQLNSHLAVNVRDVQGIRQQIKELEDRLKRMEESNGTD